MCRMQSYEDTMTQLSEMESRFQSGFSSSDRSLLEALHRTLFGKGITNTGCSDCYRDAYILIVKQLKTSKKMPDKPNYILKAGALIHPTGTSKFYTNAIPDDVAEEHLSKYPNDIIRFAHYPNDWEERVKAHTLRKNETVTAQNTSPVNDAHNVADEEKIKELTEALDKAQQEAKDATEKRVEAEAQVTQLQADKSSLEAEIEEIRNLANEAQVVNDGEESEEVSQLKIELETAKAELEAAKEEIATLKTDNRALKAANTRLKNNGAKESEPKDAE